MSHRYDVDFLECRLEKGLTQERLAEMADLSSSFIGHIERAEKLPAINTVAKLSRCLNISLDYLIYGTVSSCDKEHCQLYEDLIGFVDSHSSRPTLN